MIIYHGRFQPFHKGHEVAISYLLKNYQEPIVVGIVKPDPDSTLPGDDPHWPRFSADRNPFSFWVRHQFISATFKKAIQDGRIAAIVPLPRPSVNLESANCYLPSNPRKFVLLEKPNDEIENWKKQKYLMQGEEVLEIPFNVIPKELRGIGGSLIRALISLGRTEWLNLVPPPVGTIIQELSLADTVKKSFPPENADKYLRGILKHEVYINETLGYFSAANNANSKRATAIISDNKTQKVGLADPIRSNDNKNIKNAILHLTDLHFGQGSKSHKWNEHIVLEALQKDILNLQNTIGVAIEHIIISGDVAFSGNKDEYDTATKFIMSVANSLGLRAESIFVVPGNHDIDRSISSEMAGIHKKASTQLDEVMNDLKHRKLLLTKMEPFLDFANGLARPSLSPDWPSIKSPYWAHIINNTSALNIILIGINSCLISNEDDHIGKLHIGQEQLVNLFNYDSKNLISILVSHHPPRWFSDQDQIRNYAKRKGDIWLTGHIHEADMEEVHSLTSSGDILMISSSAAHAPENGPNHGYNLLVVEQEPTHRDEILVKLFPRRWRKRQLDFVADNDFALLPGKEYCQKSIIK